MLSNCLNVEIIENGSTLFLLYVLIELTRIMNVIDVTLISNFVEFSLPGNGEGDVLYAEEILQPHLKAFPKVSCSKQLLLQSRKEPENYSGPGLAFSLVVLFLIPGKSIYPSLVSQLFPEVRQS